MLDAFFSSSSSSSSCVCPPPPPPNPSSSFFYFFSSSFPSIPSSSFFPSCFFLPLLLRRPCSSLCDTHRQKCHCLSQRRKVALVHINFSQTLTPVDQTNATVFHRVAWSRKSTLTSVRRSHTQKPPSVSRLKGRRRVSGSEGPQPSTLCISGHPQVSSPRVCAFAVDLFPGRVIQMT